MPGTRSPPTCWQRACNFKRISTFMGHSSVAFTMDRYAHLLPDSQADTVAMIDAFLSRADSASRVAALITFCARGTGGFC